MKFRTTAIAMAVAGIVAAPVAVQAGADEIYASARVGVKYTDFNDQADFDVNSFASRFGARGETDLGNGLTGFGRYEWGVDFNGGNTFNDTDGKEQTVDNIITRHRYVGLKGDWGSVLMGHTHQTFYNFVVGPLDNPWWHSGNTMVEYRGRTDNAITYAGGGGAIAFGVTGYFTGDSEETAPDGIELGISFGLGDSTLAAAYSTVDEDGSIGTQGSADNDEDIIGVAWSGIGIGDTSLGVSYMNQDDDDGFVIDWLFGNAYFHGEMLSNDATDSDAVDLTLGYTQSLGRKTTMYYEINSKDADTSDSDADSTAVMAVLKYDII
ncbi:MAG: porin [Gammaproteobacteria bacterium]|nr:porin [Gammaproteobacteria bacterium]